MKKIIIFTFIIFSSFLSSCIYTEETYIPAPSNYYYGLSIDAVSYVQNGNFIDVYFTYPYVSGRDYFCLLMENPTGNILINGKRWIKVSDDYWISPITIYVDGSLIRNFRTYRCIILSSWGNYSQEFLMNVY